METSRISKARSRFPLQPLESHVMSNRSVIVVINPGSTSTKLVVSDGDGVFLRAQTLPHGILELGKFETLWDQFPFRLDLCRQWLRGEDGNFLAVVAMGGLLRPAEGGIYGVNDKMIADARANLQGEHASNLGCALAHELAKDRRCPAYVVDPVSVDEFEVLAYYSGHPCVKRRSLSHALNLHAAARRAAAELKVAVGQSSFVIGHLGGGISIAAVRNGKIIDVNDAASDGPFSPERTGGLPLQQWITLCCSGKFSEAELRAMVMGKGGLVAYLGTNSMTDVEERIRKGDHMAKEVLSAMTYQIAKEIGAMATVLEGRLDAIVLTGGVAHSTMLTTGVIERVKSISRVLLYPGEDEMRSLALAAIRVLRGEEQVKEY